MSTSAASVPPLSYKIALIGPANVGKTSMITRFLTGKFSSAVNTVQASCIKKIVDAGGQKIQLEIWDTAGQERYRSVGPLFFRNAVACVAVYDVTDPATLSALDGYLQDYKDCFEAGGEVVVVGNKMDLVDGDEALKEGQEYAEVRHYGLFGTSARSGAGIEELFRHIADTLAGAGGINTPTEPIPTEQAAGGTCC
jgi:small GTP-binding protein